REGPLIQKHRRINVARAQLMQTSGVDVAETQRHIARQTSLDTDRRLNEIRLSQTSFFQPGRLRLIQRRECCVRRDIRKEIEQEGIVDNVLSLIAAVESVCLQRDVGADQVVKNTGPSAHDSL